MAVRERQEFLREAFAVGENSWKMSCAVLNVASKAELFPGLQDRGNVEPAD